VVTGAIGALIVVVKPNVGNVVDVVVVVGTTDGKVEGWVEKLNDVDVGAVVGRIDVAPWEPKPNPVEAGAGAGAAVNEVDGIVAVKDEAVVVDGVENENKDEDVVGGAGAASWAPNPNCVVELGWVVVDPNEGNDDEVDVVGTVPIVEAAGFEPNAKSDLFSVGAVGAVADGVDPNENNDAEPVGFVVVVVVAVFVAVADDKGFEPNENAEAAAGAGAAALAPKAKPPDAGVELAVGAVEPNENVDPVDDVGFAAGGFEPKENNEPVDGAVAVEVAGFEPNENVEAVVVGWAAEEPKGVDEKNDIVLVE